MEREQLDIGIEKERDNKPLFLFTLDITEVVKLIRKYIALSTKSRKISTKLSTDDCKNVPCVVTSKCKDGKGGFYEMA